MAHHIITITHRKMKKSERWIVSPIPPYYPDSMLCFTEAGAQHWADNFADRFRSRGDSVTVVSKKYHSTKVP